MKERSARVKATSVRFGLRGIKGLAAGRALAGAVRLSACSYLERAADAHADMAMLRGQRRPSKVGRKKRSKVRSKVGRRRDETRNRTRDDQAAVGVFQSSDRGWEWVGQDERSGAAMHVGRAACHLVTRCCSRTGKDLEWRGPDPLPFRLARSHLAGCLHIWP